ncbi:hypothetical protein Psfp_04147 [Pelotomaculum sp. FP]|nr:hypothetical protein Psfp_04147 [Pelotomaculum sp. FP]
MQEWIVRVKDKNKAKTLSKYCNIIFVSKFINTIGIEASEVMAEKISKNPNVISIRPSEKGHYQYQ